MGRIRSIKPEFPLSETTGNLSRDARLLFIQLWTIVDDEGRSRAASRMLASLLYPYDDDARDLMDGWLSELERNQCIRLYEVEGSTYLEIVNWLKHQKIDHASKSRLPAPREDSRILAPDLGPRIRDQDQGSKKELSLRSSVQSANVSHETPNNDWPKDYRDQFWAQYPRKQSRKSAFAALDKIRKAGEVSFQTIMTGVAKIPIGEAKFIPHGATWLNGARWDDDPIPIAGPSKGPSYEQIANFLGEESNYAAAESGYSCDTQSRTAISELELSQPGAGSGYRRIG